ncbi:GNAT family N-acetyltransferase [Devosia sp. FKR38]|uniref:GNAT family N-acetyltransferase n=1 Tax=Devosia sp. FKR38 TaxID=2562312 RepID=UPI0010C06150|nr:GNAT family N-acetyltransferase [Devosia sp. FKR38]
MTRDLPETIACARLTLRPLQAGDVSDIVAMANNPKMLETTATLPHPFGMADADALIAQAATSGAQAIYGMVDGTDRLMGVLMVRFKPDQPPEVGYWLGEPHWGHGYVAEALNGLLAAVRQLPDFAVVSARVLQSNAASVRVLEKAGFAIVEHTFGVLERHRGKPLYVMQWRAG